LIIQQTHTPRAKLINTTLAACPNTPLLLSGYSQGAQLVHLAAASLPANTTAKISSVVLFGDPKNGTAIQGIAADRVLTICHSGMLRLFENSSHAELTRGLQAMIYAREVTILGSVI